MKKILLSLFLSVTYVVSIAQEGIPGIDYRSCSAAERNNEIINNDPAKKELMENAHEWALKWTEEHYGKPLLNNSSTGKSDTILFVIPVVWHVIHNDGQENISKATIEYEMEELNKDYQKLNPSISVAHPLFAPIVADVQVEFRLARLDPDGNCTEGITRTKSELTYAMDESAKFLPGAESWNRNGRYYLNIWVGVSLANGAGGYAYYPGTVGMDQDGLVLRYQQLGNTVTHEVGHWLNLAHCWGNSNTPGDPNNCNGDDGVADTPNTIGQTGCTQTAQSCGSIDNVQNYMEYNFCDVMFTEGQKQRAHAALNSPSDVGKRKTMWSANNRLLTGTDDPYQTNPVCILQGSDFKYNKKYICEGDSVSFQDYNTYNGVATMWDWTFNGGTPSSSSQEFPTVTYNTAGVYDVIYSPGNSAGWANQAIKNGLIVVSSINADYTIPFSDSFENTTSFNNEWIIETESGNSWQNVNFASYTGNRSVRVNNLNNSSGDITELISPSYDLSAFNDPYLEYKWSYVKTNSGAGDQFLVFYSLDCGYSWTNASVQVGATMSTGSTTNSAWTPTSPSDWKTRTVNLSSIAGETNVRFKFRLKNGGGNNFYLDDININGSIGVGIDNYNQNIKNLKVYPNPTKESAIISFNLINNVKNLKIVLRDVLGKEVAQIVNGASFNTGKYTVAIDQQQKLSSGLYFIEFNADNNIQIEKLIVE